MKINYIIAMYLGNRRNASSDDSLMYLEEHLKFLESLDENSPVKNIVFSINMDVSDQQATATAIQLIKQASLDVEFQIKIRPNSGYSYGNWNETLIEYRDRGFDYHFLIEDDYMPVNGQFYLPFLNEMKDEVAFVCLKMEPDGFLGYPSHPGISNGLISNDAVRQVYNATGAVFQLNRDKNSYAGAVNSQVSMTNLITFCGLKWAGVSDEISKPFWDISYGLWERADGPLPPVIVPIGVDLTQPMVKPDMMQPIFSVEEA